MKSLISSLPCSRTTSFRQTSGRGPTGKIHGRYPMHCHNVVHEDHAMMLRGDIVP